jgi:glycerate dehydrogenase
MAGKGGTEMKIVVLDGHTLNPGDNPWTEIESLGKLTVYDRTEPGQVVERSQDADILIVNKVKLSGDILGQLPALKFIGVTATGFDVVDTRVAKERGVLVSNVPEYGTDSVAQHVIAMMLHFTNQIGLHDSEVHRGEWGRCRDFCFWRTPLVEVAQMTMGIIGFGRIGRRVGELAHALGMGVLACDAIQSTPPQYSPFGWVGLEQIAEISDVITLHCPLTEASRGLVNRAFLSRAKSSCLLINAARGPLVVDQDLADALNQGRIAGAALDVVSVEPIRDDNPLMSAKNCLITPHIAWATVAARKRLMATTAENVRSFQKGSSQNVVNP